MAWERDIIEEAEDQLIEEEFEKEVARVKEVLKDKEWCEKKLEVINNWLVLYAEGKNPLLDGDVLNADTFNQLK